MADQRSGGIAWTESTWNPVRGCSRVSEGCRHCYAETMAGRFCGEGQPYEGLVKLGGDGEAHWTGDVVMVPARLSDPLRWKRPRRIFVNSMSDLFHEALPVADIETVFAVMAAAPQHTFQVLTKRATRMAQVVNDPTFRGEVQRRMSDVALAKSKRAVDAAPPFRWPLPNVWLGVSVENQRNADQRVPMLLGTAAAVRFISAEPLLGPVSLGALTNPFEADPGVHWVIVGGESGTGARPMAEVWATSLVLECRQAQRSVFVKQLGNVLARDLRCSDRSGKDVTEFPQFLQVQEYPEVRT